MQSKQYAILGTIGTNVTGKVAGKAADTLAEYNVATHEGIGICRHVKCDGFLTKEGSQAGLCAHCLYIDRKALAKRANRMQDTRDKVDAVNALTQDLPIPDRIVSRYASQKKHWSNSLQKEPLKYLQQALQGANNYSFQDHFNVEKELALYKIGAFQTEAFQQDPMLKQFVHKCENDGLLGRHLHNFVQLYVEGKVHQKTNPPHLGAGGPPPGSSG